MGLGGDQALNRVKTPHNGGAQPAVRGAEPHTVIIVLQLQHKASEEKGRETKAVAATSPRLRLCDRKENGGRGGGRGSRLATL